MKSIGIDIGTTTICIIVLDDQGQVLYRETVENDSFLLTSNDVERIQDVDIIISKTMELLKKCLEIHNDVLYIGLTGQMHGIVYVDNNGKAISPLYTWQDQRGHSIAEEINMYTKYAVASGYGLVTHAYHVKNNLVPKNVKYICTIMDYLALLLTDTKKPLVHVSNAASFGFWDIEKGCFDIDLLERFNIDKLILPDVTEDIVSLGNYNNIPVFVALGDNQASFLSTAGNSNDTVLVNMGTGGQVSLLSDSFVKVEGVETRPFIDGKYLLVGASLCGGRAYAILERFFRMYVKAATGIDKNQYETMNILADSINSTSLKVTTTLQGTRTHPNQLGSILNISEDNFLPEFLIYGFNKGMIDELYDMYVKMKDVVDKKTTSLKVSGNAMRKNDNLRKICESQFSMTSELSAYEEEAACGAAMSYKYRKE